MKFNVLLSLLLLHNIMAFELHVQPSIRKATGNVHKYDSHQISSKHRQTENKDEKLQKWRRSELQKLANIFAGKLLNDPNFANMEFVEQSASKYYLDVDSLDKVFKKMETNGLALRTQIYEEIKTAGLLEDKGDIKEVLRVSPIFKEMSQREKHNLRITDQKVAQKIQQNNMINGSKMSTPRGWKTFANLSEIKNHKSHEKNDWNLHKMTEEKAMIEQKYLKKKQKSKVYKEKGRTMKKELEGQEKEISDLKRSEVYYKVKCEQLEKELENREKELNQLKKNEHLYTEKNQRMEKELAMKEKEIIELKNGGAAATAPNRGGIFNKLFGGGPEEEANRVDTLNSKLAAKQHELHNLDRDISTKLRQLKNIEAEIGQTNNVGQNHTEGTPIKWKKVSFADSGLSPNYQQNIDQNFMKVITSKEKNDASAAENDEETSVIKTPRRIVTLNKRKPSRNSSAPDYEADAETKAVDSKASRRVGTLNKRNQSKTIPDYEADSENEAANPKGQPNLRIYYDTLRQQSASKTHDEIHSSRVGVLSPSWARKTSIKKKFE
ncbi:hypothetical protein GPALN_004601 [Globodera pallida]|nr:hypothetical protein GPALN_004601 [Globodera pallida]